MSDELTPQQWRGKLNQYRMARGCKEANMVAAELRQDWERLRQRADKTQVAIGLLKADLTRCVEERDTAQTQLRQAQAQVAMLRDLALDLREFIVGVHTRAERDALLDRVKVALAATPDAQADGAGIQFKQA